MRPRTPVAQDRDRFIHRGVRRRQLYPHAGIVDPNSARLVSEPSVHAVVSFRTCFLQITLELPAILQTSQHRNDDAERNCLPGRPPANCEEHYRRRYFAQDSSGYKIGVVDYAMRL
jgi:hypothetical protein